MRDMQHSHAVASMMLRPQHATVLKGDYSAGQLLYIMEKFRIVKNKSCRH